MANNPTFTATIALSLIRYPQMRNRRDPMFKRIMLYGSQERETESAPLRVKVVATHFNAFVLVITIPYSMLLRHYTLLLNKSQGIFTPIETSIYRQHNWQQMNLVSPLESHCMFPGYNLLPLSVRSTNH